MQKGATAVPRPEFRQEAPHQLLIRHHRVVERRCALYARRTEPGILPGPRACDSLTDRMRPATDLLVALLVALAAHGCARVQVPQPTPAAQAPMRHVLPNGVRVIIQE